MSFDMKYIDAERLREELQKPKTELKVGNYYLDNSEQAVGYENALIDFELLIDSLQQEQPEEPDKSLEEEVKNYFQGYWPGTETAEQCNTDLHFTPPAIIRLASHFAEWQKELMMEEAVETELYWDGDFLAINLNMAELGYSERDKVRLIVLPKNDEK